MEEIRIYNTLDSTNVEAQRLLTNPSIIAHGTTLVALAQTAGKGQLGRAWHATPGEHLAMTVILRPDATAPDLPRFSKLITLAICKVLENLDPALLPQIKWPNDIYLEGKKAAGILIENALSGHRIQHLIAGIGINVNETSFPNDLANAISLRMVCGKTFDIIALAKSIQEHILVQIEKEPRRYAVQAGDVLSVAEAGTENPHLPVEDSRKGFSEGHNSGGHSSDAQESDWEKAYSERLYLKNQITSFHHEGTTIHGKVLRVDDSGRLVLDIDGNEKSFYTHEIKWII